MQTDRWGVRVRVRGEDGSSFNMPVRDSWLCWLGEVEEGRGYGGGVTHHFMTRHCHSVGMIPKAGQLGERRTSPLLLPTPTRTARLRPRRRRQQRSNNGVGDTCLHYRFQRGNLRCFVVLPASPSCMAVGNQNNPQSRVIKAIASLHFIKSAPLPCRSR